MVGSCTRDPRPALFALTLRYVAPLARVDELLAEHVRFLERYYSDGTFLLSGRQVPRTGGFILAVAPDRAAIDSVIEQDPFCQNGVADYDVVEVMPTKAEPRMEALLAGLGAWP